MKKILSVIIIVLIVILAVLISFIFSQKTPDEKITGLWEYQYNDDPQQKLYLTSDDDGLNVGSIGEKVEVFPLKKGANPNGFHFLLEENDGNYEFYVEKIDKKHITIEPEDKGRHSLQERIFGTKNLSEKAIKEKTIELKKSE
ncbi:hypothetical protein ACSSAF_06740 [Staphylococcus succinus]|uniref:hypothetical protein n=1 Tax=Staphylococcus succinus TaxID=61015 RepID=UPI003F5B1F79